MCRIRVCVQYLCFKYHEDIFSCWEGLDLGKSGCSGGVQDVGGIHGSNRDTVHRLCRVHLYTPVKVTTLLEDAEWKLEEK